MVLVRNYFMKGKVSAIYLIMFLLCFFFPPQVGVFALVERNLPEKPHKVLTKALRVLLGGHGESFISALLRTWPVVSRTGTAVGLQTWLKSPPSSVHWGQGSRVSLMTEAVCHPWMGDFLSLPLVDGSRIVGRSKLLSLTDKCKCEGPEFNPWFGKSLEKKGYPLQYSGLENPTHVVTMGSQRAGHG